MNASNVTPLCNLLSKYQRQFIVSFRTPVLHQIVKTGKLITYQEHM